MPFRRNPDFVQRGSSLDQLHRKPSIPVARVALAGLGGVGYDKEDTTPDSTY